MFCDGQDLLKAKELAKTADAVVFVVGYNHDDENDDSQTMVFIQIMMLKFLESLFIVQNK